MEGLQQLDAVQPETEAGWGQRFQLEKVLHTALPAYSSTARSVFHFRTRQVQLALSVAPGKLDISKRVLEFALEYRPSLVPYPGSLSTIFGSKPLNLNAQHIRYASESMFTGLRGTTYEFTLNWLEKGTEKMAFMMISAETGHLFFYPGSVKSARGGLAREAGIFVEGLLAETITNIWCPMGRWYLHDELAVADFRLSGPITLAPAPESPATSLQLLE